MAWCHTALTAGCCTLLWAKHSHAMVSYCFLSSHLPLCKTGEQTVGGQTGRGAQTSRGLCHDARRRRRGGWGDRCGACHRGARRGLWRRYAVDRRRISTANTMCLLLTPPCKTFRPVMLYVGTVTRVLAVLADFIPRVAGHADPRYVSSDVTRPRDNFEKAYETWFQIIQFWPVCLLSFYNLLLPLISELYLCERLRWELL